MSTPLTQEQNLLFQSYFTFSLLVELKNNRLLNSDYFQDMHFGAPWIKDEIRKIGVDNQGCTMIALYVMLVLPQEIIQQTYSSRYEEINAFLHEHVRNTNTNYSSDGSSPQYLRHIRNSVAHARVEFRPGDVIIFKDENSRTDESFSTEFSLNKLGELLQQLQQVHLDYIQDLQEQNTRSD